MQTSQLYFIFNYNAERIADKREETESAATGEKSQLGKSPGNIDTTSSSDFFPMSHSRFKGYVMCSPIAAQRSERSQSSHRSDMGLVFDPTLPIGFLSVRAAGLQLK